MRTVAVRLGSDGYQIHVGPGLLAQAGQQLKERGFSGKLVIITNPLVKRLYGEALKENLTRAGFKIITLEVPDGEEQKSLDTAGSLYQELTNAYAERTTPVLALGGGVIGDLAGFVAATYQRGLPLIQIPTTLLAQVDSSIGGKVAVNHGQLKNTIGVFYQPRSVITDISTLRTLDAREFNNGLAEVIKSAVVWDREFFNFVEKNLAKIKALDETTLDEIVFRCAKIKAEIVEKDEKDLGLRSILNYGHTVGHAIESASDFGMAHGEAVAVGMIVAGRISHKLGILAKSELARLKKVIAATGLPTEMPDLKVERIVQAMQHDKKILRGKIRFVLPKAIGEVLITDEVTPHLVEQVLVGWNEET